MACCRLSRTDPHRRCSPADLAIVLEGHERHRRRRLPGDDARGRHAPPVTGRTARARGWASQRHPRPRRRNWNGCASYRAAHGRGRRPGLPRGTQCGGHLAAGVAGNVIPDECHVSPSTTASPPIWSEDEAEPRTCTRCSPGSAVDHHRLRAGRPSRTRFGPLAQAPRSALTARATPRRNSAGPTSRVSARAGHPRAELRPRRCQSRPPTRRGRRDRPDRRGRTHPARVPVRLSVAAFERCRPERCPRPPAGAAGTTRFGWRDPANVRA